MGYGCSLRGMGKLLKKNGFASKVLVTDKLRPSVARRELKFWARHEQGMRRNNQAEHPRQVIRRRERKMQLFSQHGAAFIEPECAQIVAVEVEQIEGVKDRLAGEAPATAPAERLLQGTEVRGAARVEPLPRQRGWHRLAQVQARHGRSSGSAPSNYARLG